MGCFDNDVATAFVDGELRGAELRDAEHHVDSCDRCRRLVAALLQLATPSPHARTAEPLALGATVGRYAIRDRLGSGAMGVVYRAHDPVLDRDVALKLISEGAGRADPERLLREARALARIRHPNVVTVHDAGLDGDELYIAMELVEGVPFDRWLAAAVRTPREIVSIFLQAGRGLAAVHAAGVVHGDVKPRNLLVGYDGRVRVADFGLASTRTGPAAGGTPRYMAPEQRDGVEVDARADQYSYGLALADALAGRVPRRIAVVVERGTRPARGDRFATMNALVAALERAARPRTTRAAAAVVMIAVGAAGAASVLADHRDAVVHAPPTAVARTAEAEAWWRVAVADRGSGATEPLFASARAATAGGADHLAARAWMALAMIAGVGGRDRSAGDRWASQAAASLERSSADPAWHVQLSGIQIMAALAQGRRAEARAGAEQLVARATADLGPRHAETTRARDRLGMVLLLTGDPDAAVREFRQVVAVAEETRDPELVSYRSNLGQALTGDEAIALLTGVVADRLESDESGVLARALLDLAAAHRDRGNRAAATRYAERALAIIDADDLSDRDDAVQMLDSIAR